MRIFVYECISAGGLGHAVPASLRREGWAMLSAVVADFQRIADLCTVTLIDAQTTTSVGVECHRCGAADELRRFRDIAASCDWTLVIAPEFDDLLHDRSEAVLAAGGRLLGSAPAAIRLTGDKLATAAMWRTHGVRHPVTKPIQSIDDVSFDLPCVIKPRCGAGSQATMLIRAGEESSTVTLDWPGDMIAQPYVPGEAVSVSLLIGARQTIALAPARQRLSNDGRFAYLGGSLPLPAPLADRATALARRAVQDVPGLHGYVGVDMVLGEDDWAIEINPRLTTSYIGLRQACRQNIAELMFRLARGEHVDAPAWSCVGIEFDVESGWKKCD